MSKTVVKQFQEQLEQQLEVICDDYCKFREQYLSEHKDPDEAFEALLDEKCNDCPIGKIV